MQLQPERVSKFQPAPPSMAQLRRRDWSNPFVSNARELAETQGNIFPISSSSDGGRVSFIPINRGLEFYDRYTGDPAEDNSR